MLCGQLKRPLVAYRRNIARFCASSYRYGSAYVKRTVPMIEKTAKNAAVTTRSSRGPYKTVRLDWYMAPMCVVCQEGKI